VGKGRGEGRASGLFVTGGTVNTQTIRRDPHGWVREQVGLLKLWRQGRNREKSPEAYLSTVWFEKNAVVSQAVRG